MFIVFTLAWFSVLLLILFLLGVENQKHTSSKKLIQVVQEKEMDNDRNNETLSEMIEYHKKNPTIKYRI